MGRVLAMKPATLGNVNPCGAAVLLNRAGKPVAQCYDTPNSVALAFQMCPRAVRVVGAMQRGTRGKYAARVLGEDQKAALARSVRIL